MSETILITGAAARVGGHLAKGLANDGHTIIVHYNRSEDRAEDLIRDINQNGGRAFAMSANLSVPSDLNLIVSEARELSKRPLTVLINNASTFDWDRAQDFSKGTYDHHMSVNLFAPIKLAQGFAAQLPDGKTGSIVNIIDQRVLNPDPDYFTYRLSKVALFEATKTLAQSFAPQIRVNGIGPGPTLQNKVQSGDVFDREQRSTLLGRGSPPDTILHGVRYLLSAEAVTGQMIAIDGGQHLYRSGES